MDTHWSLKHPDSNLPKDISYVIRGVSTVVFSGLFHESITFSTFPVVLHEYVLTCGTAAVYGGIFAGLFPLIVYRKSTLAH